MSKLLPILLDLPPMRCDADCDLCCSDVVPVSESELVRVLAYANERGIEPQVSRADMCPWYGAKEPGRCAVYEVRPLMCQLYGHVDHPSLTCAKDPSYNANVGTLPTAEVYEAKAELGPSVRYLHEVLDAALVGREDESVWRARVHPDVWDGINQIRESSGLPALTRKHNYHQQKDGTP